MISAPVLAHPETVLSDDPVHRLSQLGEVCSLHVMMSDGAYRMLAVDRELMMRLLAVAQEAVFNAVQHGNAASVYITVFLDHDSLVRVQVSDDGSGVSPGAIAGNGARLLARLAPGWRLDGDVFGSTLYARVA